MTLLAKKLLLQEQIGFEDVIFADGQEHTVRLPAGEYIGVIIGAGGQYGGAGMRGKATNPQNGGAGGRGNSGSYRSFYFTVNNPLNVTLVTGTNTEANGGNGGVGTYPNYITSSGGAGGNGGNGGKPSYIYTPGRRAGAQGTTTNWFYPKDTTFYVYANGGAGGGGGGGGGNSGGNQGGGGGGGGGGGRWKQNNGLTKESTYCMFEPAPISVRGANGNGGNGDTTSFPNLKGGHGGKGTAYGAALNGGNGGTGGGAAGGYGAWGGGGSHNDHYGGAGGGGAGGDDGAGGGARGGGITEGVTNATNTTTTLLPAFTVDGIKTTTTDEDPWKTCHGLSSSIDTSNGAVAIMRYVKPYTQPTLQTVKGYNTAVTLKPGSYVVVFTGDNEKSTQAFRINRPARAVFVSGDVWGTAIIPKPSQSPDYGLGDNGLEDSSPNCFCAAGSSGAVETGYMGLALSVNAFVPSGTRNYFFCQDQYTNYGGTAILYWTPSNVTQTLDFGKVTEPAEETLDYGSITEAVATEIDYGKLYDIDITKGYLQDVNTSTNP